MVPVTDPTATVLGLIFRLCFSFIKDLFVSTLSCNVLKSSKKSSMIRHTHTFVHDTHSKEQRLMTLTLKTAPLTLSMSLC